MPIPKKNKKFALTQNTIETVFKILYVVKDCAQWLKSGQHVCVSIEGEKYYFFGKFCVRIEWVIPI